MIKLFTLDTPRKPTEVFKSFHTLESRGDTLHHRDHNIHKEDYKAILEEAVQQGLFSYRNRGRVVIVFKDIENIEYGVLVEVTDKIYIVTVYYNKKENNKNNFIKCNQRIRLINYTLDTKADLKETVFITPKKKLKKAKPQHKFNPIRKIEKPQPKPKPSLEDIEISEEEKDYFLRRFQ